LGVGSCLRSIGWLVMVLTLTLGILGPVRDGASRYAAPAILVSAAWEGDEAGASTSSPVAASHADHTHEHDPAVTDHTHEAVMPEDRAISGIRFARPPSWQWDEVALPPWEALGLERPPRTTTPA
jgi:hypothetical protein